MTRQRQRVLDAIQEAVAEGVPATYEEILTLLAEWMREPDDLGEDWWATFEKEMEAQRFHCDADN